MSAPDYFASHERVERLARIAHSERTLAKAAARAAKAEADEDRRTGLQATARRHARVASHHETVLAVIADILIHGARRAA